MNTPAPSPHAARDGLQRLLIVFAPLSLAWFMGTQSLSLEIGGKVASGLVVFVILGIVYSMLTRVEDTIRAGRGRRAAIKYLIISAVPVMLSIVANFNVIYVRLNGDALMRTEIAEKRQDVLNMQAKLARLQNPALLTLQSTVNRLLDQLQSELLSLNNVGQGKQANQILDEIEKTIGFPITRHPAPGNASADMLQRLADRYRQDILQQMQNHPLVTANKTLLATRGVLDDRALAVLKALDAADKQLDLHSAESHDQAINAIKDAVAFLLSASTSIGQFRGTETPPGEAKPVFVAQNADLGRMEHSIRSGLQNLHRPATWLALFLAIAIDLLAILLVLFTTEPGPDPSRPDGSRSPTSARARDGLRPLDY